MQEHTHKNEIKLIGVTVRTSNADEANPAIAKIGPFVQNYLAQGFADKIPSRTKPYTTYSVFTEYESDHNGYYTYFLGEEVDSFDNLPEGFSSLVIPAQKYAKFTNGPGPMPSVCVDLWMKIWQMNESDFGGKRSYIADFEIYDERALDRENTVLDIYIGINS